MLVQAGYRFEVCAADIDERVREGESAGEYVRRLAAEKSQAGLERLVAATIPDRTGLLVLAADTAVVVDGAILGKPHDDEEGVGMLGRLSGRSHEVLTGVSLRGWDREVGGVESTVVWVSPLTAGEVTWYVGTGEGRDKAGGYAIQGRASRFVPRIEGSYSNVVGLPMALVHRLIAAWPLPPVSRLASGLE